MRFGQKEAAPFTRISRKSPSAMVTPTARPAAVSQTSGSPLRDLPVVENLSFSVSAGMGQTSLFFSRRRWRRISAMVLSTKVIAKRTIAPRKRVR